MSDMSSQLINASSKYSKGARDLYRSALLRKYAPWAALAGVALLVLLFRWLYSK